MPKAVVALATQQVSWHGIKLSEDSRAPLKLIDMLPQLVGCHPPPFTPERRLMLVPSRAWHRADDPDADREHHTSTNAAAFAAATSACLGPRWVPVAAEAISSFAAEAISFFKSKDPAVFDAPHGTTRLIPVLFWQADAVPGREEGVEKLSLPLVILDKGGRLDHTSPLEVRLLLRPQSLNLPTIANRMTARAMPLALKVVVLLSLCRAPSFQSSASPWRAIHAKAHTAAVGSTCLTATWATPLCTLLALVPRLEAENSLLEDLIELCPMLALVVPLLCFLSPPLRLQLQLRCHSVDSFWLASTHDEELLVDNSLAPAGDLSRCSALGNALSLAHRASDQCRITCKFHSDDNVILADFDLGIWMREALLQLTDKRIIIACWRIGGSSFDKSHHE
jgi:hypothetical protein